VYKLFLSVRYLLKPLSIVAVLALGLSVMALTAAPAVMAGFQADFHARVRGTQSDMSAWSERPLDIERLPRVEQAFAAVPGVVAVAPYIEYPAIDRHLRKVDYCFIRAIEPKLEEKVSDFRTFILSDYERFLALNDYDTATPSEKRDLETTAERAHMSKTPDIDGIYKLLDEGDVDPDDDRKRIPCVLAGIFYLRVYGMDVGDVVRLTTATEGGDVKQDFRFKVVGGFRTGTHRQDRQVLYMGLKAAQDFIGVTNVLTGYSIKLQDYNDLKLKSSIVRTARGLMAEIAPEHSCTRPLLRGETKRPEHSCLPNGMYVKTWEERDENLLKAVGMEKFLIKFITSIIVVAASASIFLVVYMTANTKIRELGILRAMGGSRWGTFQIFITQGSFLAVTGLVLGSICGLLIAVYVNEIADFIHTWTGWHPFPPEVYYLERIPARVEWRELLINTAITLVCGVVFALIPAFIAAGRPPIRAIRYE
jgi:lipoprotein-releasing system permease protein